MVKPNLKNCNKYVSFGILFSLFASVVFAQRDIVITSDIDLFWETFDLVKSQKESAIQIQLFDSLYLKEGTIGLKQMAMAKNYDAELYVDLINKYPRYWESIRTRTYKAKQLSSELESGIEKLRKIYPEMKPATIYFVVGAMRRK